MNYLLLLALLGITLFALFGPSSSAAPAAKEEGEKFLAEKAKQAGVFRLKSGMLFEKLHVSDKAGRRSPTASDQCRTTYEGTFIDGKRFDGGTTSFAPNQVIKGW